MPKPAAIAIALALFDIVSSPMCVPSGSSASRIDLTDDPDPSKIHPQIQ
jgi:hypothetical protein